jgi:DNA-binding Lrp family transcriptional regulator
MKFDEVDLNLLRNLQREARTNFADIAKECDVSVDTIIKRFQRMKRNGIIKGTTILLDPRHLGFGCLASLEIGVEPQHIPAIVDQIRQQPGVTFCSPCVGAHNVFAVAILQSIDQLNSLKDTVKGLGWVREVKTSIWVDEVKLCPENFELEVLLKS